MDEWMLVEITPERWSTMRDLFSSPAATTTESGRAARAAAHSRAVHELANRALRTRLGYVAAPADASVEAVTDLIDDALLNATPACTFLEFTDPGALVQVQVLAADLGMVGAPPRLTWVCAVVGACRCGAPLRVPVADPDALTAAGRLAMRPHSAGDLILAGAWHEPDDGCSLSSPRAAS